ncbi:hypothetical protein NBRC111894_3770 [Sporolactobacillus inulinus]|uniref:Uncharacterized protein n=1 Tax=Sporolactobacillus inulinus TaxID=2078 RepID=A0A4Y1ZGB9_9BACL|nr:hypothetical protein NBRC111894_3770 [Sporolactobacillus inulinus]
MVKNQSGGALAPAASEQSERCAASEQMKCRSRAYLTSNDSYNRFPKLEKKSVLIINVSAIIMNL